MTIPRNDDVVVEPNIKKTGEFARFHNLVFRSFIMVTCNSLSRWPARHRARGTKVRAEGTKICVDQIYPAFKGRAPSSRTPNTSLIITL